MPRPFQGVLLAFMYIHGMSLIQEVTLRCASLMPGRNQPGPPSFRGSFSAFRRVFLTVSMAGAAGGAVLLLSADASCSTVPLQNLWLRLLDNVHGRGCRRYAVAPS